MTPTTPPETCELQDPQEAASTTRPAGPVHAPLRTEIGGTERQLAPPAGAAGRLGRCSEFLNRNGHSPARVLQDRASVETLIDTTYRRGNPGPVNGFILRPVQAQHQYEFALGSREPIGLLVSPRELVLYVQVR